MARQQTGSRAVADGGYTTRDNIQKMAARGIDFLGSMRWENVPSGASIPQQLPPSAFVYQPEVKSVPMSGGPTAHSPGSERKKRPGLV